MFQELDMRLAKTASILTNVVVLGPNEGYEKYGTEDPRLIEIDNRFYISYVVLSDYVTSGSINSSTALSTTDDYTCKDTTQGWE